jgi:5'-nucleotidase / UDP-sugar diphosphatase
MLVAALVFAMVAAPAFGQGRGQGPPEAAGKGLERAAERASDKAGPVLRDLKAGRTPNQPVDITLIYDTHFHGLFGQDETGAPGLTNIGRYMALAQQLKDEAGPNSLYIGNGDDLAPSLLSGVFTPHGVHMVDAFNVSPIDVNTMGNHEFDFGPDNLRTIIGMSDFPWVTANVRDIATGEPFAADLGVQEWATFDFDGVLVGVTGVGPQGMATITNMGDETEQIDAAEALADVVPRMRAAGIDVVVVASHLCGPNALEVAAAVDGIDAIVGDHCAQVLDEPQVVNDTIVSFVGDEFRFMGELRLTVRRGNITDWDFTLHSLQNDWPNIAPHPAVQAIVDDYNAQLDEQLNVVIGSRTVVWDTRNATVRTREEAFANYLTDEIRAFHGSDIAVTNSGGIRGNQLWPAPPTDVTRRDIATILPFANHLVKAEISGATLLEALEHSVSGQGDVGGWSDGSGRFLQVSGMSFTFDTSQPRRVCADADGTPPCTEGQRVQEVLIGGEPLDPNATYTMSTNDFTLGGGDAFTMFRDDTTVIIGPGEGPLMSTFLIGRIEARSGTPIATDVEGRIVRINE